VKPEDITWGAFQAYGDPGWRAEARVAGKSDDEDDYASPDELLDELVSRRASLSRAPQRQTPREIDAARRDLKRLLKDRCPAGWLQLPAVQSALAGVWADLGRPRGGARRLPVGGAGRGRCWAGADPGSRTTRQRRGPARREEC
jgi:hypothetical protein